MTKSDLSLKLVLAVVIFVMGVTLAPAQTIQYLNSNNIVAGIGIGGNLFSDSIPPSYGTADLFKTKFDSGRAEIYTAALWMNGLGPGGNLYGAAQQYFDYGLDYYDGPITLAYNAAYDTYYKRVFKVTQIQITQFKSLNFPTTSSLVDSAILYWPGKGNPSVLSEFGVSIDSPLAPFIDVNNNGIYDPLQGDYPAVVADQNIFFVFNDTRGLHYESGCTPMGVEIRGMASSFLDTSSNNIPYNKKAINNSIFIQYEIENKSQQTYTDFDLGFWCDPDMGCWDNDYVGCDSARSLMFAYNGVPYDPDCLPELGFDSLPVALGIQILSQPMDVFGYLTGCEAGCLAQSDPDPGTTCAEYRNFLQGYWGDGTPFEYGKSGYNSGGRITKFCFPGDPTDTTQWSEAAVHSAPGDRRMFSSTNWASFIPGQTIHYGLGFTTSFDSTSNYISIVDSLKKDADTIRNFYLHHILPEQQILGITQIPHSNPLAISIYPNPSNNQVTVSSTTDIQSIELMDIEGRVIIRKTVEARYVTLPVSNLAKGLYLVNVFSSDVTVVKKVIVE